MLISVPFKPMAAMRPKINRGKMYDPQSSKKEDFMWLVKSYLPRKFIPFSTAVSVIFEFHMPIPGSLSKKKQKELLGEHHLKKPDLSNLIKFVEDACNGVLWLDDRIIANIEGVIVDIIIAIDHISKQ